MITLLERVVMFCGGLWMSLLYFHHYYWVCHSFYCVWYEYSRSCDWCVIHISSCICGCLDLLVFNLGLATTQHTLIIWIGWSMCTC